MIQAPQPIPAKASVDITNLIVSALVVIVPLIVVGVAFYFVAEDSALENALIPQLTSSDASQRVSAQASLQSLLQTKIAIYGGFATFAASIIASFFGINAVSTANRTQSTQFGATIASLSSQNGSLLAQNNTTNQQNTQLQQQNAQVNTQLSQAREVMRAIDPASPDSAAIARARGLLES